MRVFVDWSFKKGYEVIYEYNNGSKTSNHVTELSVPPNTEVCLESGCSKFILSKLIDKGHKIFVCQGNEISFLRKKNDLKKTDKTDVVLINNLYHQNPEKFVELNKQSQNYMKFKFIMSKFEQMLSASTCLKNQQISAEREFGESEVYKKSIVILEKEKAELIKQAIPLISEEYNRLDYIRGIDKRIISRLFSFGHPHNFSTLSKWLVYCGYKGCSLPRYKKGEGKRPNYKIKSVLYLMALGTMTRRDLIFRKIYDECKERFVKEHSDYPKWKIHGMALNRVATLIAKEIWIKTHNIEC